MQNIIGVVSCHLDFSSLREAFEKARAFGFGAIEWFEGKEPTFSEPESAAQIAELSKEFGIAAGYHAPYLGRWDLGRLAMPEAARRIEEVIVRAERLGAESVTIHWGTYARVSTHDQATDNVIGAFAKVATAANDSNVRLCVENSTQYHCESELGVTTDDFARLFDQAAPRAIGFTLDVGHANVTGNLYELIEQFGDRLWNTHLHDTDGVTDGHEAPGKGNLDWQRLFSEFVKIGYSGPLNFEFPEATGKFPKFVEMIRIFR